MVSAARAAGSSGSMLGGNPAAGATASILEARRGRRGAARAPGSGGSPGAIAGKRSKSSSSRPFEASASGFPTKEDATALPRPRAAAETGHRITIERAQVLLGAEDRATERMVAEHRAVDEDVRQCLQAGRGRGPISLNHRRRALLQLVGVEPRPADRSREEADRLDDPVGRTTTKRRRRRCPVNAFMRAPRDLGRGVDVAVGRMVLPPLKTSARGNAPSRSPRALRPVSRVEGDDRRDGARAVDADARRAATRWRAWFVSNDAMRSTLPPATPARSGNVGSRPWVLRCVAALRVARRACRTYSAPGTCGGSASPTGLHGRLVGVRDRNSVYGVPDCGATLVGIAAVIRLVPAASSPRSSRRSPIAIPSASSFCRPTSFRGRVIAAAARRSPPTLPPLSSSSSGLNTSSAPPSNRPELAAAVTRERPSS